MSENIDRRKFLTKSALTSVAATVGLSCEEQALRRQQTQKPTPPKAATQTLPLAQIKNVKITRLICGGNLVAGYAHSRDLIYVSSLLKNYFNDEKILETLTIAEQNGINTVILNNKAKDFKAVKVLDKYRKIGGKIQWLAQVNPEIYDCRTTVDIAVDHGAIGAFIQGGIADEWVGTGRVDLIGKTVDHIKQNKIIAGVGGHKLDVPIAVESAKINPDFYFKTLNTADYHCDTPEQTIEFMKTVKKPWIAYKVLGAGVIPPRQGFKYAFENGADLIVVGMFDFQIPDDVYFTRRVLSTNLKRKRPWFA